MKLLKVITDQDILGTSGMSDVTPRNAARAILKRRDGMFALIYEKKYDLFLTVGGGVEKGENLIEALEREVLEEKGCTCDFIMEIGYVHENRYHSNFTQNSYYYYVETEGQSNPVKLTDDEKKTGTELRWYTFEEFYKHITLPVYTVNQRRFVQAKDTAVLNAFLEMNQARKFSFSLNPIHE